MTIRTLSATVLITATMASPLASASGFDNLKKSAGDLMSSSQQTQQASGASGLLGRLAGGSMNLGSAENAAGVLGYCEKNGYAPSAADTVKSQLMSRFGGTQKTEQSEGYKKGLAGLLQGGQSQSFSLTGLKDRIGKRVCRAVADKAVSSFLGG